MSISTIWTFFFRLSYPETQAIWLALRFILQCT